MKQKTQSLPHWRGVMGSKSMPHDSLSPFSTSIRHSSPSALTTSSVRSSSPDVRNLKSSASRTRRPLIVQTRSPISNSSSAASDSGSTPMIFIPLAIQSNSQDQSNQFVNWFVFQPLRIRHGLISDVSRIRIDALLQMPVLRDRVFESFVRQLHRDGQRRISQRGS